jgi:hypothetical protein
VAARPSVCSPVCKTTPPRSSTTIPAFMTSPPNSTHPRKPGSAGALLFFCDVSDSVRSPVVLRWIDFTHDPLVSMKSLEAPDRFRGLRDHTCHRCRRCNHTCKCWRSKARAPPPGDKWEWYWVPGWYWQPY